MAQKLNCANMTYDYQLVGGSAPCALDVNELIGESLEFHPNPASSGQNIQFSEQIASLQITDLAGRIVANFQALNSDEFSVSGIHPGVYFLILQKPNGKVISSRFEIE